MMRKRTEKTWVTESEYVLLMTPPGAPGDDRTFTVGYDVFSLGSAVAHPSALAFGLKVLAAEGADPTGYTYRLQRRHELAGRAYYKTALALDYAEVLDVLSGASTIGPADGAAGAAAAGPQPEPTGGQPEGCCGVGTTTDARGQTIPIYPRVVSFDGPQRAG